MIIKEKVKKNFSRGAKTYEEYAKVQRHMAFVLESFIDGSDKKLSILEVGSGTGIFTEYLLEKFPHSEIHLIDISEEMLDYSRKKFKSYKNIEYFLGDAEDCNFTKKYDFIVSNASFQWFNDLEKSIKSLKNQLADGGQLIFSIFAQDTYKELRDSFSEVDQEYDFSQRFRSREEISAYDKDLELLDDEVYYESYKDIFSFLKSIKSIGANSAKNQQKVLTYGKLKSIQEVYMSKYSRDGNLIVTNHLLYFKLRKTTQ